MKIKDYFKNGFGFLIKAFANLGKGIFFGVKRWFVEYPHFAYPIVIILLIVYHIFTIASARSERDSYNHSNAMLRQQLDSATYRHVIFTRVSGKDLVSY